MIKVKPALQAFLLACCFALALNAQEQRRPRKTVEGSTLTGVYRLNVSASDRLYSVVSGASSNLPFGEQQRFFIDLTIRLTPPDQLAIERRGRTIQIASSRAPRTTFEADGRERREAIADGYSTIRVSVAGEQFVINSRTSDGEGYTVIFAPVDGGRRLHVTRHISARELNQPVVIQSVYDRISEVAEWGIYGEPSKEIEGARPVVASAFPNAATKVEAASAETLRAALDEWIAATNERDITLQISFYMPTVQAFYLTRNVRLEDVRAEKARVFARATVIDIRAAEPEIIFREAGQIAIMRFRKRYRIEGGRETRRGEVVQELRWRRTAAGWKIFSERDVRVIK